MICGRIRPKLIELAEVRLKPPKVRVGEGLLDEVLAVVELPVHGDGPDVPPDRVELLLLPAAHLAPRVEDRHVDPLHPFEGLAHGASRVPGCGDQDVQPFPGSRKALIRRAIIRAAKSLKEAVGP